MFPYNCTLPCVNSIPCLVLIVIFDIMYCHSHRSMVMLHLEWKNSLMPVYCNKAKEDKMQNILDLENISIYITVKALGTLYLSRHTILISKESSSLQDCGSVLIFYGSGSGSRAWWWRPIRIWIRIRIQYGSRALMTKNWNKNYSWKFF